MCQLARRDRRDFVPIAEWTDALTIANGLSLE